jgi:hypothetical protein
MLLWKYLIVVATLAPELISCRMQEFLLDVDDILSERLMPLMLLEEGDKSDLRNLSLRTLDDEFKCVTKESIIAEDGTFGNAFSSMGYHRKMINNFLCSKFVAETILDDVQPRAMKNRLGVAKAAPEMEFMANESLSHASGARKSHMLYDEGSYEYKNWLAK